MNSRVRGMVEWNPRLDRYFFEGARGEGLIQGAYFEG